MKLIISVGKCSSGLRKKLEDRGTFLYSPTLSANGPCSPDGFNLPRWCMPTSSHLLEILWGSLASQNASIAKDRSGSGLSRAITASICKWIAFRFCSNKNKWCISQSVAPYRRIKWRAKKAPRGGVGWIIVQSDNRVIEGGPVISIPWRSFVKMIWGNSTSGASGHGKLVWPVQVVQCWVPSTTAILGMVKIRKWIAMLA